MKCADLADDQYFDLQEQGAEEQDWDRFFRKARLLLGIADAFRGSRFANQDVVDAIYEWQFCTDSPKEFLTFVETQIVALGDEPSTEG